MKAKKIEPNLINLPIKNEKTLIQARVPSHELELLKSHNVDIPELVRQAVHQAFLQIKKV